MSAGIGCSPAKDKRLWIMNESSGGMRHMWEQTEINGNPDLCEGLKTQPRR